MASSSLEVTALTTADAGELLTLRRAAFARAAVTQALGGVRPDGLLQDLDDVARELADPNRVVLGGRHGGRLVASIRLDIEGETAALALFAVAPDLQHQGFGTALLKAVPPLLPDGVGEVRIVPLPGTEDSLPGSAGYSTEDLSAFALVAAYLRRIGAD